MASPPPCFERRMKCFIVENVKRRTVGLFRYIYLLGLVNYVGKFVPAIVYKVTIYRARTQYGQMAIMTHLILKGE